MHKAEPALGCRFALAIGLFATVACQHTATPAKSLDAVQALDTVQALDSGAQTPTYLQLRPLSVSADRRIVDDTDREVLLRGVNITSLGQYWQGDPVLKPTAELTETDWQDLAAQGFSVIRLVIHWSLLEPTRGALDQAYLKRVDGYVRAAAAHGLYTVIDMHQDAYCSFIYSPLPADCSSGTQPAKGWDGAPAWATQTDGLSTCVSGDRNSSPAVTAAWNHFYDNTDGIRYRFVATWAGVAAYFAGRPEVAGYDLLNEPEVPRPAGELAPLYNQLLAGVVTAIRQAEAQKPFGHLLIVEPAIAAGHPQFGLVVPAPASVQLPITNLVAGPHNYAEAIGNGLDLSIEDMSAVYVGAAANIGVPAWIGEHGFWDTNEETLARLDRYAADEDARVLGGAWWQWRQPCGDPHSVPLGGYAATGQKNQQIHLHGLACPGDVDLGPTEPFLRVLRRAAPRAVPGRIATLKSDWKSGSFSLSAGQAAAGGPLVVWLPGTVAASAVSATGLQDVVLHPVPGGAWLTATVTTGPSYSLGVTGH